MQQILTNTAKKSDLRTRRRILETLKQHGPQDAPSLAPGLGVSAMAVRQHLYQLHEEKLVSFDEQPRPKGRPAKMWRLTDTADRLFPDAHAALAVDLVECLKESLGQVGVDRLIDTRAARQIEEYRAKLPDGVSLGRRLRRLAQLRTEEGYMAEVVEQPRGVFLLIENHCPICTAATACTGLCAAELQVFQAVLGKGVVVERTEHILDGARRCVYQIRKQKS